MSTAYSTPDLSFEKPLWLNGIRYIAGLDEAGRGAWAGPVCAGAVILPEDTHIHETLKGVRDSKQMTPRQRAFWASEIQRVAVCWGIGFASNEEIDEIGILPATRLAMIRALEQLSCYPQHLLIDAVRLKEIDLPQTNLIKGDQRSLSIAAGSVLAKTSRDTLMIELSELYPDYGFGKHKGYGTAQHQASLQHYGSCPIHRQSFAPIRCLPTKDEDITVTC